MPYRKIDSATLSKATVLLKHGHWRPGAIANKSHTSLSTAYRWENSIQRHGVPRRPKKLPGGRPPRLTTFILNQMLEYLKQHPWLYQDELARYLQEEWSVVLSRQSVGEYLRKAGISRKKGQRIGHTQSRQLRVAYQADMASNFNAEHLVCIDESLFKIQSCWRAMAYAPIGQDARWSDDLRRGDTYSILPAYTVEGYLPCTGIKKGYYNGLVTISLVVLNLTNLLTVTISMTGSSTAFYLTAMPFPHLEAL